MKKLIQMTALPLFAVGAFALSSCATTGGGSSCGCAAKCADKKECKTDCKAECGKKKCCGKCQ